MTASPPPSGLLHLRVPGTSLVLDATGPGIPAILYWGAELSGDLPAPAAWRPAIPHGALDTPVAVSLLPHGAEAVRGTPALAGSRDQGRDWSPALTLRDVEAGATSATVVCADPDAGLRLTTYLDLEPDGVLRARHVLRNEGETDYTVSRLAVVLPLPAAATELLDLTGRWCRERHPQRHSLAAQGTWVRDGRHGRTGHDATLLLVAGTPGFGNRAGETWGVHLGWSGDHTSYAERWADGRAVLGVAELFQPGEVVLRPGEEYATPEAYAARSDEGLDGLSRAFHRFLRARPQHPSRPRPVVLNTWEAVYFDHRLERLTELAKVAAEVGVERFVLDDGWFLHRRHDRAGLGDWVVDPQVWPDGLAPLIDQVRGLGMEFGLWVEPEMINLDSDLYRAHPDWVLRAGERLPLEWRQQQVLDLVNPDAWQHILDRLDALLREHEISYLKWDHNRDLVEAGSGGRPAVHRQTLAVYRLLDELRARHPGVEIESCSSGGARVDLGILARTDRVWASDTNDALERQTIQRWTQLLLPPELVGSHVGPPTAHLSGRTHHLSFRGATALFGHFGIEWDVTSTGGEDRAALGRLVATYKRHRDLLHSGDVVHGDPADPSTAVHGVVARDRGEALFAFVQLASSAAEVPNPVRLPGLDPARTYRVQVVDTGGTPFTVQREQPAWMDDGSLVATGSFLASIGVRAPVLGPEQALVLHLTTA
jgi:alpha-galactosidase